MHTMLGGKAVYYIQLEMLQYSGIHGNTALPSVIVCCSALLITL